MPSITNGLILDAYELICNIRAIQDMLEDLWDRIQSLSKNGWKVDSGKTTL